MAYQIERRGPCRVFLTASFPSTEVTQVRADLLTSWQHNAHVDGFRVGKAPRALIERRHAKEIGEELREKLMHRAWETVRDEAQLRPAGPLEVKDAAVKADGSFELAGELDVYPEVELKPVEDFTPPEVSLECSDEEVDKTLAGLQERQAAWEPMEGEPASEGMLVEAEMHGAFPDGGGEPFHEERSLFQIGRGEVFPEIEGAVLGRQVGDEVAAERRLGEETGEERAGKLVSYRVLVKSLRRKRLPELDDAFAQSLGASEGLANLRETVRERLGWEKQRERRELWRQALIAHLAGGKALELPERLVAEETREELVKLLQQMERRGLDQEQAKIDWEKLEADMRRRVEERLRGELVLDALAEQLGIAVTDAEVEVQVQQQARAAGIP
ncbi:MAG: trigger factor, partial [Acidobacteriota bacterium]